MCELCAPIQIGGEAEISQLDRRLTSQVEQGAARARVTQDGGNGRYFHISGHDIEPYPLSEQHRMGLRMR